MRLHIIFRYVGFVFLIDALFLLVSSIISAIHADSGFGPLLYSFVVTALFGVFPLIFVPASSRITNNPPLYGVGINALLTFNPVFIKTRFLPQPVRLSSVLKEQ